MEIMIEEGPGLVLAVLGAMGLGFVGAFGASLGLLAALDRRKRLRA